ncbi:ribonuclease H-like domain-containing protein [Tanacetum coccineum]|uniref:Ribonuclease H-like domain-containing protein n=1 Tax=Tanacetum coccineum TaxID=301880 RepID=A0ABQ4XL31_9ASTR
MSTVRCVIALSVTNNWPLFQLDANNVFLFEDLDEDIYMTIPKGFASKYNKNKVCKLVMSLYGLKQALRKWNEKLVTILKENDFVQSANDHSLFTKSKNSKFIALLVYVDGTVVTENCVDEIDNCALNVMWYLKGAPGKCIRYKFPDIKNSLNGYSDAYWANCLKTTRKSVTDGWKGDYKHHYCGGFCSRQGRVEKKVDSAPSSNFNFVFA